MKLMQIRPYWFNSPSWHTCFCALRCFLAFTLLALHHAAIAGELSSTSSDSRIGKAQTVLGLVDPESLGVAMTHEHLISDGSGVWFSEPEEPGARKLAHMPVSMDILWWLRENHFNNRDNFDLTNVNTAINEAKRFKLDGGGTIVDLTTDGHGRNVVKLQQVARATDVNVIAATGWYIAASHPKEVSAMSVEEMAERMVKEITVGIDDTGIRAGIIGEIGSSAPLHEVEKMVLRAAAIAQRQTGAPLNVHPSPADDALREIVQILEDSGADPKRTVFSHVDGGSFEFETLTWLAEKGYYLSFDTFGYVHWMRTKAWNTFLPNDAQRIDTIIELVADGYIDQILVSHDIYFKNTLVTYGGYGYGHIMRNTAPAMQVKGLSEGQVRKILIDNPRRILSFVSPRLN